jgi:hypothetical protein
MDPVTLIVTALAAGAASALLDRTSAEVKDAYGALMTLARRRLAGSPAGELVLARHAADPQTWEAPLSAELSSATAEDDVGLVAAAQVVMSLVDRAGARAGKYVVTIEGSQGVQIGDHNTQTNTFRPRLSGNSPQRASGHPEHLPEFLLPMPSSPYVRAPRRDCLE